MAGKRKIGSHAGNDRLDHDKQRIERDGAPTGIAPGRSGEFSLLAPSTRRAFERSCSDPVVVEQPQQNQVAAIAENVTLRVPSHGDWWRVRGSLLTSRSRGISRISGARFAESRKVPRSLTQTSGSTSERQAPHNIWDTSESGGPEFRGSGSSRPAPSRLRPEHRVCAYQRRTDYMGEPKRRALPSGSTTAPGAYPIPCPQGRARSPPRIATPLPSLVGIIDEEVGGARRCGIGGHTKVDLDAVASCEAVFIARICTDRKTQLLIMPRGYPEVVDWEDRRNGKQSSHGDQPFTLEMAAPDRGFGSRLLLPS